MSQLGGAPCRFLAPWLWHASVCRTDVRKIMVAVSIAWTQHRSLNQVSVPEVAIYRYVTEGSFDAYMWQALETKARFIAHYVVESIMWRPTAPPPVTRATSTWNAT